MPVGSLCPHVVVDVFLESAQKIVEFRLPIKFENELPFAVELCGVNGGMLLPKCTKYLTCDPLRNRCVIRPVSSQSHNNNNNNNISTSANNHNTNFEFGACHLGLHYGDLHFLFGQVFLACFPIVDSQQKKITISTTPTTNKTDGSSIRLVQQQQNPSAESKSGGIMFEDGDDASSAVTNIASAISQQRALYALISFSPLKVIQNVGGPAIVAGSGGHMSTAVSGSARVAHSAIHDITITLQAPFHIQNHCVGFRLLLACSTNSNTFLQIRLHLRQQVDTAFLT
jgi:hypothetical protein